MKIVLTGATGFIGSHLAAELVKRGHEVYAIIRHAPARELRVVKEFLEDVAVTTGDLTSYQSVSGILRSIMPDTVIHLAALSPVRLSFERPFEYELTNTTATMNIVHALLELPDASQRRLIAAATAEVYGPQPPKPIPEETALQPSSPYAVRKAAADLYIRMAFTSLGLHGTVMRPVNTFGRKFDSSFVVEYLVTSMLKGQDIYIGAPESVRDYMYIDDHVAAYLSVIKNAAAADRQVFNVSTGQGVSNRELAMMIARKLGFDTSQIHLGVYPPGYPYRPLASDQPYIVLDATKIKEKLGWKPTVSLEAGLDKTIVYWSTRL